MKRLCTLCLIVAITLLSLQFYATTVYGNDTPSTVDLPIVMYHSILKNRQNDYIISPTQLENDFIYIKNHGFNTISASQLVDFVKGKASLPTKPIMLTFDDGYYNNLVYASPLLKKYNFTAIINIVGKFTEISSTDEKQVADYSHVNWEQIQQMQSSGVFEIGSHTYNLHHINAVRKGLGKSKGETTEQYINMLTADLTKNKNLLQTNSHIVTNIFAYPFGTYNKTAEKLLNDMGYDILFTCNEGINHLTVGSNLNLLKRFNRPARYSTNDFFTTKKIV